MKFTVAARRFHMYLALFLVPWMLVYGLSVLVMNHMPFFADLYGDRWGEFVLERELSYAGRFAPGAAPDDIGQQVLRDLDMEGSHWIQTSKDGGRITINRNGMLVPRRVVYTPADGTIVIERQSFQTPLVLRRLHTRRGYGQDYLADDVWAAVVDLVIVGIVLWGVSGLWMWWRMRSTRRLGIVCGVAGLAIFTFFLFAI